MELFCQSSITNINSIANFQSELLYLKGNSAFFEGVVLLVGNGCLSLTALGTSFFIFIISIVMFKPNFARCENQN